MYAMTVAKGVAESIPEVTFLGTKLYIRGHAFS